MNDLFRISLLFSLLFMLNPLALDQTFEQFEGGDMMTQWISPEPHIGTDNARFFLCGYGFRKMKWQIQLYNCNCGPNNQGLYQCDWCPNYFFTKTNAFKAIFCDSTNWSNQITNFTYSGNNQSGSWRVVKCPINQYASRVAIQLGTSQQNVYLGMNGLQIKCQNIGFNESKVIEDNTLSQMSQMSVNKQGNFISGYQIGYKENGQLTGAVFGFQPMSQIKKIQIKYGAVTNVTNVTTITIDSNQVSNIGINLSQTIVNSTRPYALKNTWTNEKPHMNSYPVSATASVYQLALNVTTLGTLAFYIEKTEPFAFGKQILTVLTPSNSETVVTMPACNSVKANRVINQQKVRVLYDADLIIVNRFNGNPIGNKTVKGVWEGVMVSGVQNTLIQTAIKSCLVPSIALTQNQIISIRWKFYNNQAFLGYMKFLKGGTMGQYQGNNNQKKWSFDGKFLSVWGNKGSVKYHHSFRDFLGKWHLVGMFMSMNNWQHVLIEDERFSV